VFKAINSTVDGILSLGELLDMAARLELFLTEEEGSRIFSLMDMDGDEKV
jgi:Ca2+-binding EF-hand superfamily protein